MQFLEITFLKYPDLRSHPAQIPLAGSPEHQARNAIALRTLNELLFGRQDDDAQLPAILAADKTTAPS